MVPRVEEDQTAASVQGSKGAQSRTKARNRERILTIRHVSRLFVYQKGLKNQFDVIEILACVTCAACEICFDMMHGKATQASIVRRSKQHGIRVSVEPELRSIHVEN